MPIEDETRLIINNGLATIENDNIKDVVAFPKTQSAKDMMMQAPSDVDPIQLKELEIKVGK